MKDNEERTEEELEECEWCNSTGDIKRTNRIYWGTVLAIVIFLIIVYVLATRT